MAAPTRRSVVAGIADFQSSSDMSASAISCANVSFTGPCRFGCVPSIITRLIISAAPGAFGMVRSAASQSRIYIAAALAMDCSSSGHVMAAASCKSRSSAMSNNSRSCMANWSATFCQRSGEPGIIGMLPCICCASANCWLFPRWAGISAGCGPPGPLMWVLSLGLLVMPMVAFVAGLLFSVAAAKGFSGWFAALLRKSAGTWSEGKGFGPLSLSKSIVLC